MHFFINTSLKIVNINQMIFLMNISLRPLQTKLQKLQGVINII